MLCFSEEAEVLFAVEAMQNFDTKEIRKIRFDHFSSNTAERATVLEIDENTKNTLRRTTRASFSLLIWGR